MILKKVARPFALSSLCNRSSLQYRGLLQKTFNHDESDFTHNRCSTFYTTSRCFTVRHILCDPTEKFRSPMLGEYIKGRLRAFVFFFQHPSFKFRDALKGCEEAMSIVSDMITKKQFDKLQGMIDSEVLNHLEGKLATTSWIYPISEDPAVRKFDWHSFKEIENTDFRDILSVGKTRTG
ncbi:uncharacterized protein LOC125652310 isoform X1 [Ostrea edulis]|uniref:uncharacterized protein LOC125652310 isoform X1 n=1 Tax=Ostrea edulis TaxID=37623 RepID=UPI0024AF9B6C|nr:uncharacterized protein LOC125652310 isoform X1 [Ostrea edulis]